MEFRLNICKVQRIQQPRELAELVFYIPKLPFFYPSMCCAVLCLVTQSCLTLCNPWPVARQAPLSMGILQARILEWVAMSSSRGSYQPWDRTQVSHIAGGFFTDWVTRKAQVGSLSLLQGIVLIQESNQGLLHFRWLLYPTELPGKSPFIRQVTLEQMVLFLWASISLSVKWWLIGKMYIINVKCLVVSGTHCYKSLKLLKLAF